MSLYLTRQPVTDANYEAFRAACVADPKPHLSSTAGRTRLMSTEIMADWLLAHPGCTQDDVEAEFTAEEIGRFFRAAKQYAIRKSGDLH